MEYTLYNRAMELQDWKRRFLEYTEIEKGRSVKTIENYDRYITRFLVHTKLRDPKDINYEVVREYRLWLNRQVASATRRGVPGTT